jgi:L-threonylcarbamoyladenylate synthase
MPRTKLARIYRGTPRNLSYLAACLKRGELVAVPTETVYGLAANALDPVACREIFRAKGRPTQDPLIVHLKNAASLDSVAFSNGAAEQLAARFWPGPLTLVLPKKPTVPDIVSAGLPSVAVRVPAHPLFRRLLKMCDLPLAAPSANPFGYISPTCAEHVRTSLGHNISHILDGGPSNVGVESTIIDLRDPNMPTLLRPGAITRAELAEAIGKPIGSVTCATDPGDLVAQIAPGRLTKHYSPKAKVVLHKRIPDRRSKYEAWVFLAKPDRIRGANIFWLDAKGQLTGAARRLFSVLRALDTGKFATINIEFAPVGGIGDAINDRLKRAASV